MKSKAYLRPLAFSILLGLSTLFTSCDYSGTEYYSFENGLNEDIELFLYVSNDEFNQTIEPYHFIAKGETAMLLVMERGKDDRDDFGHDYLNSLVDSVKVKFLNQEQYIAIWRQNGSHQLAEGYESLEDFYLYWPKIKQHTGRSAEYGYCLKLKAEE